MHFDPCTTASGQAPRSEEKQKRYHHPHTVKRSLRKERSLLWVPVAAMKPQAHPLDVKAGDRILFGKWSGTEVKIDGDDLLIMKKATSLARRLTRRLFARGFSLSDE